MRDDIRRVRQYELMTIFSPEVPEEDFQRAIDRVSDLVTQAGGTVTLINRESPWGRRRLSYPIRHNSRDVRDGIYVLYYVDLDAQSVAEVERDLKLMDNLMRYLVTQQVAEPMIPESEKPAEEGAVAVGEEGAEPAVEATGEPEAEATGEAAEAAAPAEVEAAEETPEVPTADEPALETAPTEEAPTDVAPVADEAAAETLTDEATATDTTDETSTTDTTEETAAETGEETGNQG